VRKDRAPVRHSDPYPPASPALIASAIVESGVAPSAAAGCSVRGVEGWYSATGGAVSGLFDLASLTKPMTAVAVAARSGALRSARLGDLLPAAIGTASEAASLELLLAHRAGLEAHIPIFEPLVRGGSIDPQSALRLAANTRRPDAQGAYPDGGFAPVYSDLGYALVGAALAREASCLDAGEAIARLVVDPLLLGRSLGTARELAAVDVGFESRAAPTEDVAWRGGLVRGRVHDENAWALTGEGGSGHAGMFGTVGAVLRFGEAVLAGVRGEGPLAHIDLSWLVAARPGGTLGAGFDRKSPEASSAGVRFGPASFGHLGFTGTSLWIDPDAGVVAVLLTNRVCPSRERTKLAIRAARPTAHDALHRYASTLLPRASASTSV
jgi:CubicO group peptidase (beta-lactamase class C family)